MHNTNIVYWVISLLFCNITLYSQFTLYKKRENMSMNSSDNRNEVKFNGLNSSLSNWRMACMLYDDWNVLTSFGKAETLMKTNKPKHNKRIREGQINGELLLKTAYSWIGFKLWSVNIWSYTAAYKANVREIQKPNFTWPFNQLSVVYDKKLFSIKPPAFVKNKLKTCPPVSSSTPNDKGIFTFSFFW